MAARRPHCLTLAAFTPNPERDHAVADADLHRRQRLFGKNQRMGLRDGCRPPSSSKPFDSHCQMFGNPLELRSMDALTSDCGTAYISRKHFTRSDEQAAVATQAVASGAENAQCCKDVAFTCHE